uniref:HDC13248 n=1 Tax=Drosophila melanogaster TaxID=7227 RepID=Q6IK76_DROME|nr:TPA_inf: HDC13248 [Drosophila melanogaster]
MLPVGHNHIDMVSHTHRTRILYQDPHTQFLSPFVGASLHVRVLSCGCTTTITTIHTHQVSTVVWATTFQPGNGQQLSPAIYHRPSTELPGTSSRPGP